MSKSVSKGKTGASQGDAAQASTESESAAKLVLTADFRVSEQHTEQAKADNEIAEDTTDNLHQSQHEPQGNARNWDAKASSLESTIAELEATVGQQPDEWEPDGGDLEEDADTAKAVPEPTQDWVDSAAEGAESEDAPVEANTAENTGDTLDNETAAGEDTVIDEETLRNIVGEIVRQELQGALGERITRNVRKLVRREINIVLSAQDFE